jgi:dienelactone hydrolase
MVAALLVVAPAEGKGRDFVELLTRGSWEQATGGFDSTLAKGLDAEKLSGLWASLIGRLGAFESIERVEVDRVDRFRRETVICAFASGQRAGLRVVFDQDERVAGFFVVPADREAAGPAWSPPAYADPARFTETAIEVGRKRLRGALTVPNGAARFPIVVMLAGSGPNDMDESLGSIKVLKDLAWGLASLGVAALRFEKRTHRGIAVRTVGDEYLEDARAAIDQAAAVPGRSKLVLLGHSLGAMIAPRIAVGSATVAAVVLLAGSTWPYAKVLVRQLEYQKERGFGGAQLDALLAATREEARAIDDPALEAERPMPRGLTGAYYLDLRSYDQVATAAWLELPIFIAWGDKDLKVIPEDFDGWKKLADRPNVTLRVYHGLQHLFTPVGRTGVRHVANAAIEDLAAWIPR